MENLNRIHREILKKIEGMSFFEALLKSPLVLLWKRQPRYIWKISNSNWTEWGTIQGVIGRVILNRLSA